MPFTASPAAPEAVEVRRPSDILFARIAAKTTFVGLFLGLGAVALLVGGVGIANIMVISVLERRGEIGLRRALGARARHIAIQFILESIALAVLGGLAGVGLGCLATLIAAHLAATRSPSRSKRRWPDSPPPSSSACSPAFTQPPAPPDSHPPMRSAPSNVNPPRRGPRAKRRQFNPVSPPDRRYGSCIAS